MPEHYEAEAWKIHTDDMFAYFVEPIKSQLMAKNIRQKEPRAGKIDYDVDGKLVGNWFVENSGGYKGGGFGERYWSTHLAFVYDGQYKKIYVNGVSYGSIPLYSANFGISLLEIGQTDFLAYPLDGYLDEMKFYNRALSQAEILSHYDDLK